MKTPRSLPNRFPLLVGLLLWLVATSPLTAQDQPEKKAQVPSEKGVAAQESPPGTDRPAAPARSATAELKRARQLLT
ncbi:MAG: hypothetical protein ACKOJF_08165, partial [Planctomycetaceae bacterium]